MVSGYLPSDSSFRGCGSRLWGDDALERAELNLDIGCEFNAAAWLDVTHHRVRIGCFPLLLAAISQHEPCWIIRLRTNHRDNAIGTLRFQAGKFGGQIG